MTKRFLLISKRLIGAVLAAACALQSTCAVLAADAPDPAGETAQEDSVLQTVHIRTAEDLITLSENSKTDSYSKGKLFCLENDIDLTGTDFSPIAVFTGTFDGMGHTISGFTLGESGKDYGLFRYVEKDAVVQNLTLSASICPEGSMERIGGFAGTNRGTIRNCVFTGTLVAKKTAGGIVGLNAPEGIIDGCANRGELTVTKQGGGIAGRNEGLIQNSSNLGNVNASTRTVSEIIGEQPSIGFDVSTLGIDAKKINYTGGIAGSSCGEIRSCANSGQVGYSHTGYNVGGIVGYHQGKTVDCTNSGAVMGRKNVGGIAGQFEPHITTVFEADSSDDLRVQGRDLRHMMDSLADTMDSAADAAGNHLDSISDTVDGISDSVNDNIEFYLDWGDSFSMGMEDELDALDAAIDRLGDGSGNLREPLRELRQDLIRFNNILGQISIGGEGTEWDKVEDNVQEGIKVLPDLMKVSAELSGNISELAKLIQKEYFPDPQPDPDQPEGGEEGDGGDSGDAPSGREYYGISQDAQAEAVEKLNDLQSYVSGYLSQVEKAVRRDGVLEEGSEAAQNIDYFSQSALSLVDEIEDLLEDEDIPPEDQKTIEELLEAIRNNIDDINDILDKLVGENGTIQDVDWDKFQSESQVTKDQVKSLQNAANDMLDSVEDLLDELSGSGGDLKDDAREIRRQATHLSSYIRSSLSQLRRDASGTRKELSSQNDALSDQLNGLRTDLSGYRRQISSQLDIISSQMELLGDSAADGMDRIRDQLIRDADTETYTDISDSEDITGARGILSGCRNNGGITADINGGGVIGLIGVEMDLESDLSVEEIGSKSFNADCNIRATVLDSRNFGKVTVKNNCAGGIVGRADAGAVIRCDNFGAVKTTNGSYAGGVAGKSHYLIRNCYSLCDVTGQDYVGGIAGLGCNANNNYVMTGISSDTGEKNGSIFGDMEEDVSSSVYDNYYIDEGVSAVNNLTYESAARPIRYQELLEVEGIPQEFRSFTVQFVADGKEVKRIVRGYGQKIRPEEIPPVPERNGLAGVWEDKDFSFIRRNMVVEAQYSDMMTAVASPEETPLLFAVGNYRPETRLECESLPLEEVPHADGYYPVQAFRYRLLLENGTPETPSKLRVLADGGKNISVLAWDEEGNISLIQPVEDGRYLAFSTPMQSFAIVRRRRVLPLVSGIVVIAGVILAAVMIGRKRKAGRAAPPDQSNEKQRDAVPNIPEQPHTPGSGSDTDKQE
ncbi:MAG: hypothetical protein HFE44_00365 [Oscillospiraceae bacterium]|jgi:ElaB/YqjD/DUF883 family membrane-anchored ribosome-binding protein|nr:hypothetical protein [Oscillospiraceae bacterium]